TIEFTPAMLMSFIRHAEAQELDISFIKRLIAGADTISIADYEHVRKAYGSHALVMNGFGITETSIDSSIFDGDATYNTIVPVGRPLTNTRFYVLNAFGQVLPVGVPGELYIGGAGVGRGYFKRPELTAEKFLPDIFSTDPHARMYRTGDLARWLPDGNMELIGRMDHQVKIRGFRIELGEIEYVLLKSGMLKEVVMAAKGEGSNKRLIAYIVPDESFNREGLLAYTADKLPDYMVPAMLVEMQQLPLTANGKVNRAALPEPDMNALVVQYAEPSTETEKKIAAIWQKLLGIERIGIHDNFFDLGGHSLLATSAVSAIRKELDVEIAIRDLFIHTTIARLAAHIYACRKGLALPPVEMQKRPERIPLSFSQERLWFIDHLEGSIHYHIPEIVRLKGEVDKAALAYAFKTIVARHESLRTVIFEEEGRPWQHVLAPDNWQLNIIDEVLFEADEAAVQACVDELIHQPFDLSCDYMMRVHLIKISASDHLLAVVFHHIATDGWSSGIIARDLMELYEAYTTNREPRLPFINIQYADYAIWQRQNLDGDSMRTRLSYWQQKLKDAEELNLPLDHARPAVLSSRGATHSFRIGKALTEQLKAFCQQQEVTLYMSLLALYKVLLSRYSGQQDICVGSPVAGRQQQELESVVGFFVNTIVLRSEIINECSFTNLLQQVKRTTLEAYEYQDVPFEKVVEAVLSYRDLSRSPLVQVMFVLQNLPDAARLQFRGLETSPGFFEQSMVKSDLVFAVEEDQAGINITIEYSTDLFVKDTIARMGAHYEELLRSALQEPEQAIDKLNMLTHAERHRVLLGFNNTATTDNANTTIVHLFRQQAANRPDAVAVAAENPLSFVSNNITFLTYRELDERSNQLAHYLRKKGVQAESLVALCMERTVEIAIGMLGILKAGGAYVPIDHKYPEARISYMLQDSGATIILSSMMCSPQLEDNPGLVVIELDSQWEEIAKESKEPLNDMPVPAQLMHVIYTSGSTGTPKGTMIEHRSMVNLINFSIREFEISEASKSAAIAAVGFDAFGWEVWPFLAAGAAVYMVDDYKRLSLPSLTDFFNEAGITNCFMSTVLLVEFLKECGTRATTLKYLVTGGDRVPLLNTSAFGFQLVNAYGPTETTIVVIMHKVTGHEVRAIPIGKPMSNVRIYILDDHLQPVPIGVLGQLYIGGVQVSRGYFGQPELTAEKFIPDPFVDEPAARLYQTGDLARWLPDGNIEFGGRKDMQVKVRGFRVELGEIESVLLKTGLVQQAVAVAREDKEGHKTLVAYVVPNGTFDDEAIMDHLESILPEYMLPSVIVELSSIPLTSNGKVDRKVLPDPWESRENGQYVAPRTETEQVLAQIWQEALQLDQVGVNDNFFRLGGDSIRIISVVYKIRKQFKKKIELADIYQGGTLEQVAGLIDNSPVVEDDEERTEVIKKEIAQLKETLLLQLPEAEAVEDIYPMSDTQAGMVYTSLIDPSLSVYHNQMLYVMSDALNTEVFEQAFSTVVHRHAVLRTAFNLDLHTEGVQVVYRTVPVRVELIEPGEAETADHLAKYLEKERSIPFVMSKAPLWRATLLKLKAHTIFVFQFHHAILDGWSEATLNTEINNVYLELLGHKVATPSALKCTYKDFIIENIAHKRSGAAREFWQQQLAGAKRLDIFSSEDDEQRFCQPYSLQYLQHLQQRTADDGISLKALFLGAYLYVLGMLSNEDEVTIGVATNNRPAREDGDKVLGCFLNSIPLRYAATEKVITWKDYFKQIEYKLNELKKGDRTSLFEIARIMDERSPEGNPFFDALFSYTNFHVYDNMTTALPSSSLQGAIFQDVLDSSFDFTNTYLDCSVDLTNDELTVFYTFRKKLKAGKTLQELHAYFDGVMNCYLHLAEEKISNADVIPAGERNKLLVDFNDTDRDYSFTKTIIELFEAQVLKWPDAVAGVCGEDFLTYRQLNAKSNALAGMMIESGVRYGDRVAIIMPEGIDYLVSFIAVLKAGATSIPFSQQWPAERIKLLLDELEPAVILSGGNHNLDVSGYTLLHVDHNMLPAREENIPHAVAPSWVMSIFYTSGSTGTPRGVELYQHGILNRLLWMNEHFGSASAHSVLKTTRQIFDSSIWQLMWPLINGGRTVIPNEDRLYESEYFFELLSRHEITMVDFVPSAFKVLVEGIAVDAARYHSSMAALRNIIIGGEAINVEDVNLFRKHYPAIGVTNLYGPTEASIGCIYYTVGNEQYKAIPIGKPIANTKIFILNSALEPVPAGVQGEIFISGACVTKGYYRNETATASSFIRNKYGNGLYTRMYRTGDLGSWTNDGNIMYLGRKDEQVKIRGYRIEPAEIEHVLQQSGLVSSALVVAKEIEGGNKRLVAYVVCEATFDREAIIACLKGKLPDYMVPSVIVPLESLPLTSGGKIDRKNLPEPDMNGLKQQYAAPRDLAEEALAAIWQDLLGIQRIGIHDNFFEAGGHSLLAMRVVSATRRRLNVELAIRDLFTHPTIAELAVLLKQKDTGALLPPVSAGERPERIPLSFAQERLWFIHQLEGSVQYHMHSELRLKGRLNIEALNNALKGVIDRHEILRTVIVQEDGKPY
ncbi:MAG TPA: amino acid adenylation domain-containing protein, partial [Chitinophagaceae bacterium]|nr:amino acid adenylation domain-containing protein [Chitinophagaceae bacterium]